MLTREAILAKKSLPRETVTVPEWEDNVIIRALTGKERDAFEAAIVSDDKKVTLDNIRAKLVVRSAVNDAGERIFTDADAEALGETSAAALDRLFAVAQRLSGISKQDVEELGKNSGTGRSAGSTSASPRNSETPTSTAS